MTETFSIQAPATIGHLGPGFGVLGMAIDLFAHLEVTIEDGARPSRDRDQESIRVERRAHGDDDLPPRSLDSRHDAVVRGLQHGADLYEIALPRHPVELSLTTTFPHGVGLGSNTAEFVLGIATARELAIRAIRHKKGDEEPFARRDREINLLAELGGDPGHGAAAFVGGLAAAVPLPDLIGVTDVLDGRRARRFRLLELALDPGWFCAVVIPEIRYGASDVHRILPPTLPNIIAQRTVGRFAGLLSAFATGDEELLRASIIDEIHVPPRKSLTPGLGQAMAAAETAGAAAATIAGHGPAVIAWARSADAIPAITEAMRDAFTEQGVESGSFSCKPWMGGVGLELDGADADRDDGDTDRGDEEAAPASGSDDEEE